MSLEVITRPPHAILAYIMVRWASHMVRGNPYIFWITCYIGFELMTNEIYNPLTFYMPKILPTSQAYVLLFWRRINMSHWCLEKKNTSETIWQKEMELLHLSCWFFYEHDNSRSFTEKLHNTFVHYETYGGVISGCSPILALMGGIGDTTKAHACL